MARHHRQRDLRLAFQGLSALAGAAGRVDTLGTPDRGRVVDPRSPVVVRRPPDALASISLPAIRLVRWRRPGSATGVMGRETHDVAKQTSISHRLGRRGDEPVPRVVCWWYADRPRRHAPRRVARPGRDRQVHEPAAHPARDAAGRGDQPEGRQADRLLRDLDAAVHSADPAGRPAGDAGVGLWRSLS